MRTCVVQRQAAACLLHGVSHAERESSGNGWHTTNGVSVVCYTLYGGCAEKSALPEGKGGFGAQGKRRLFANGSERITAAFISRKGCTVALPVFKDAKSRAQA